MLAWLYGLTDIFFLGLELLQTKGANMSDVLDFIRSGFFEVIGIDKEIVKHFFEGHGLGGLWSFFRDHLISWQIPAFFAICIMLEKIKPAVPSKSILNTNVIFDYFYPFFNAVFTATITAGVIVIIKDFYDSLFPFLNVGLLDDKPVWFQAIGAFLITDIMFYISHRIMHEVPWLWHFHAIHHSQTYLNSFTTFRGHSFSGIFSFIIRTIPIAFVGGDYPAWIIFAYLNGFWGFFIHANIKTNLGLFKYVVVTPQYHRVHHSNLPRHFDKNYGERLTLWDWIFGSLYKGFDEYPTTGVANCEPILEDNAKIITLPLVWFRQFIYPFTKIYQSVRLFYLRIL